MRHGLSKLGLWVFDLDGTLIEGMPYEEIMSGVSKTCGVPCDELARQYEHEWQGLEDAHVRHRALAQTDEQSREVDRLYTEFIRAKECPRVLPGAIDVLETLLNKEVALICWTRGEPELQLRALAVTGTHRFFETVVVVSKKTVNTVRSHLLPAVYGRPFAMVGDSYSQDMLPVAGIATARIWVRDSQANQHEPPPETITDDVIAVHTVADVLAYLG